MADGFQGVGQDNPRQAAAAGECIFLDGRDACGPDHLDQTAAAGKGVGQQGGDAVRNGQGGDLCTVLEGVFFDGFHGTWDGEGTGITPSDGVEQGLVLAIQHVVYRYIRGVIGVNLNGAQSGAKVEKTGVQCGRRFGNGHGGELRAGRKGPQPNAFHTLGNGDLLQCAVVGKDLLADGVQGVGQLNGGHCAGVEGVIIKDFHAVSQLHFRQGEALVESVFSDNLDAAGDLNGLDIVVAGEDTVADSGDAVFDDDSLDLLALVSPRDGGVLNFCVSENGQCALVVQLPDQTVGAGARCGRPGRNRQLNQAEQENCKGTYCQKCQSFFHSPIFFLMSNRGGFAIAHRSRRNVLAT